MCCVGVLVDLDVGGVGSFRGRGDLKVLEGSKAEVVGWSSRTIRVDVHTYTLPRIGQHYVGLVGIGTATRSSELGALILRSVVSSETERRKQVGLIHWGFGQSYGWEKWNGMGRKGLSTGEGISWPIYHRVVKFCGEVHTP